MFLAIVFGTCFLINGWRGITQNWSGWTMLWFLSCHA